MSRRGALAAFLFLVLVAGSTAVLSALAREPASGFVAGGSGPVSFVEEARSQGYATQRLLSGPQWLAKDPGLDPSRTLLVVAHPSRGYTSEEADAFRSFLERGGRALVAETFGSANTLTAPLGVSFARDRLVEADPGRALDAALDGDTFLLPPGAMTAVQLSNVAGARPLASSSPDSFLDRDGNGLIDAADPHGPFAVAAEREVGDAGGIFVALGTLQPLTASGGEGARWQAALLKHLLPQGGAVVVDESRAGSPDPFVAAVAALAGAASAWPWGLLVIAVGALPLLAALLPRPDDGWRPHLFRPNRFIRRALLGQALPSATPKPGPPSATWTQRGTAAGLGGAGLLALALVAESRQAAYAGALLVAAALAALLLGMPRVAAQRTMDGRSAENAPLTIRLELQGPAGQRHVGLEFLDPLPPEFDLRRGHNWFQASLGRARAAVEYETSPALRGPYTVGPLLVRRSDALRLRVQQGVAAEARDVEVAPRKEPVNRSPFKTRVPTVTLGPHLVNRAGEGAEFHSLREYHEGDSFRSINWRASARSASMVVNQRVHESMTRLTIFLDARAVSAAGPASASPLAHGCRTVLGVAAGAVQVRDRIRIVLYGDGASELPAAPGPRAIHKLTQRLSTLSAAGSTTFLEALDQVFPTLKPGTPFLLVSGLEGDPSVVEGMRRVRAKGMLPIVIASPVHTAPADPDEGGPEPEAGRIQAERAQTLRELHAMGITVYDAIEGIPLDHLFRLGGAA